MARPAPRDNDSMRHVLAKLKADLAALRRRPSIPVGKRWRLEETSSGELAAVIPATRQQVVLGTPGGPPDAAPAVKAPLAVDPDTGAIELVLHRDPGGDPGANQLAVTPEGALQVPPAVPPPAESPVGWWAAGVPTAAGSASYASRTAPLIVSELVYARVSDVTTFSPLVEIQYGNSVLGRVVTTTVVKLTSVGTLAVGNTVAVLFAASKSSPYSPLGMHVDWGLASIGSNALSLEDLIHGLLLGKV